MRTRVDLRLIQEIKRFSLHYACDECAHFSTRSGTPAGACTLGWPLGERTSRALVEGAELEFCKEFEV